MSMFDYCTFKLHNIHGEERLSVTGQVTIDAMFCHYMITEHGMFYNRIYRLRNTTLSIAIDDTFDDLLLTFNWFGVVTKVVYRKWNHDLNIRGECKTIDIREDYIVHWNMDNLLDDLKLKPSAFKTKSLSFFGRAWLLCRCYYFDTKWNIYNKVKSTFKKKKKSGW